MKLDKKEIEHLAWLSRLQEDQGKQEKDFKDILDYVEKLKSVNVDNIDPTSHVFAITNTGRNDETHECRDAQDIINCASETKNDFVKVKAIL